MGDLEDPGWSKYLYDLYDFNVAVTSSEPQALSILHPRSDNPMDRYLDPPPEDYPYISVEAPLSHGDTILDPLNYATDTLFPCNTLHIQI